MLIETKRLVISSFEEGDLQDLYEILGDGLVMEHSEEPFTLKKTASFLSDFCIERGKALAARLKDNKKVIGYILFSEIDGGIYELGWFFNRNYWRWGYAYESCRAVVNYAFEELNAHKIFSETVDIERSVGLMEKLGLEREGVQRRHVRDRKGEWRDLYLYGLLEEEYEGEEVN